MYIGSKMIFILYKMIFILYNGIYETNCVFLQGDMKHISGFINVPYEMKIHFRFLKIYQNQTKKK